MESFWSMGDLESSCVLNQLGLCLWNVWHLACCEEALKSSLPLLLVVVSWWVEIGECPPLFLTLCEELDGLLLLPLQSQRVLLEARGWPLQHHLALREFLLPVLLEVVMVGPALGVDSFDCVKWPLDPFPNFVEGCYAPSVMPWCFFKGPRDLPLFLLNSSVLSRRIRE